MSEYDGAEWHLTRVQFLALAALDRGALEAWVVARQVRGHLGEDAPKSGSVFRELEDLAGQGLVERVRGMEGGPGAARKVWGRTAAGDRAFWECQEQARLVPLAQARAGVGA